MKNLILLLLVIGAVVSTTYNLTTPASPATTAAPLWTLTYDSATASTFYSLTLTYYAGDTASNEPVAISSGTAGSQNMGVACFITDSTFALVTTGTGTFPAFTFSIPNAVSTGTAATTAASTNWTPLAMTAHVAATFTFTGTTFTGGGFADCPIVQTDSTTLPTVTAFTASWTFTVAKLCGSLPVSGNAWYARCYAVEDADDLITIGTDAATLVAGNNVTVTATTTTCSTTTGASTFATGATILAGIAYLQF
jgi:hypothetical protein